MAWAPKNKNSRSSRLTCVTPESWERAFAIADMDAAAGVVADRFRKITEGLSPLSHLASEIIKTVPVAQYPSSDVDSLENTITKEERSKLESVCALANWFYDHLRAWDGASYGTKRTNRTADKPGIDNCTLHIRSLARTLRSEGYSNPVILDACEKFKYFKVGNEIGLSRLATIMNEEEDES